MTTLVVVVWLLAMLVIGIVCMSSVDATGLQFLVMILGVVIIGSVSMYNYI